MSIMRPYLHALTMIAMNCRYVLSLFLPVVAFPVSGSGQTLESAVDGLRQAPPFPITIGEPHEPGEAGDNMVWDMTDLQATQIAGSDVELIEQMGGADPRYPAATVKERFSPSEHPAYNYQHFYLLTEETLEYLGGDDCCGTLGGFNTSDPAQRLVFPASYGTTWGDGYTYAFFDGPVAEGYLTGEVDGYGILRMPYGDVEGVLRVKITGSTDYTTEDSTYTVEAVHYDFYKPGLGYPVLSLFNNSIFQPGLFGSQGVSRWPDEELVMGSAEPEARDERPFIFPNPVSGHTRFVMPGEPIAALKLSDMTGRTIELITAGGPTPRADGIDLDLTDLVPGTYFVTGITSSGRRMTSKLVAE